MALRPWSPIPIHDIGEPLEDLPASLLRLEPHPYQSLGAPYGGGGPFRLRRGVIERLLVAQSALASQQPGWRLAIFDAWRPLAVQAFMVRQALEEDCYRRGIDPDQASPALGRQRSSWAASGPPPARIRVPPPPTAPARLSI